jgi:hypothetical protein
VKKILIFLAGLLLAFPVLAQLQPKPFFEIEKVGIHIGSHHFPNRDQNNFNPGLYIVFRVGEVEDLVVGGYKNSSYQNSFYAGKAWMTEEHSGFSFGAIGGLVFGYRKPPTKYEDFSVQRGSTGRYALVEHDTIVLGSRIIVPAVIPTLTYEVADKVSVRLTFLPKLVKYGQASVVHFSVEKGF